MYDPEVLFDKLAYMGSANEIAAYLYSCGIKGEVSNTKTCALAVYFQRMADRDTVEINDSIHVSTDGTIIDLFGEMIENFLTFEHTPATLEFIIKFDGLDYPELVRCSGNEWCQCTRCEPENTSFLSQILVN